MNIKFLVKGRHPDPGDPDDRSSLRYCVVEGGTSIRRQDFRSEDPFDPHILKKREPPFFLTPPV